MLAVKMQGPKMHTASVFVCAPKQNDKMKVLKRAMIKRKCKNEKSTKCQDEKC